MDNAFVPWVAPGDCGWPQLSIERLKPRLVAPYLNLTTVEASTVYTRFTSNMRDNHSKLLRDKSANGRKQLLKKIENYLENNEIGAWKEAQTNSKGQVQPPAFAELKRHVLYIWAITTAPKKISKAKGKTSKEKTSKGEIPKKQKSKHPAKLRLKKKKQQQRSQLANSTVPEPTANAVPEADQMDLDPAEEDLIQL